MTTNIHPFARKAPADGSANIHHYIDGQLHLGSSRRLANVYNPATGQVSGRLAFANKEEVDLAIWRRPKRRLVGWLSPLFGVLGSYFDLEN
jgi:hypothetical protein